MDINKDDITSTKELTNATILFKVTVMMALHMCICHG